MATAQGDPLAIPIIDISGLRSVDPAAKQAVAAQIGAACREVGFFYVSGHGFPADTVENAVQASKRYFAQPLDKLMELKANLLNRGYQPMFDGVQPGALPDAKECFDLGFHLDPDDPDVLAGKPLAGPNRWPDLPGFKEPVEAYYRAAFDLGRTILRGFALYWGMAEDFFEPYFRRPFADMRLLHYPPLEQHRNLTDNSAGPHSDFGIITVLWQDDCGGLQVLRRDANGERWVPAPSIPGTFVVNIGDLMERWTNGRFRSTRHRVLNTAGRDRYSIPFFFNPAYETVVDPRQFPGLAEGEARYEPVLAGEYLIGRFKTNRVAWKAAAVE